MARLHDYIASPYHNTNKSLLALFCYLQQAHPRFPAEMLENTVILRALKIKCSAGELRNKMTRLLALTEDFLSLEYKGDAVLKKIGTLQAYKQLHLPRHFESLALQIREQLDAEPFRDFDYWWRAHRLEEELIEGFENKIKRVADKTMAPVIDSLDRFHQVKKMRYLCDQVNLKNQLGNTYSDQFHAEALHFIQHSGMHDAYFLVYSQIYLLFSEQDEKQKAIAIYRSLKKIVFETQEVFPKEELRAIIAYMIIFCSRQINLQNAAFVKEYFTLLHLREEKNLLTEQNGINPLVYKNCITCGLKLKEFAWVEQFIKKYTPLLPDAYRQDFYQFSMAQLHYFRQEYEEAVSFLHTISYQRNDLMLHFAVKRLLLKIMVEQKNLHLLPQQLDAYRKHLQRKKKHLGANARFDEALLYYLERLTTSNLDIRKKALQKLKDEQPFPDKAWLQKMVKERKL